MGRIPLVPNASSLFPPRRSLVLIIVRSTTLLRHSDPTSSDLWDPNCNKGTAHKLRPSPPSKQTPSFRSFGQESNLRLDSTRPTKDRLMLTKRHKEKNQQAAIKKGDKILFDPLLTAKHNINESFRVFTDPTKISEEPAWRLQNPRQGGLPDPPITVHTDRSCINNRKQNAACCAGVWFDDNHPLNRAIQVPGPDQSNQTGELAAIVVALQLSNPLSPLTCIMDSRYVLDGLTTHLTSWEDRGWTNVQNKKWFQTAAYHL